MGKPATGTGLVLPRCSSIHTCFMHFTIDIVFLDANNRVIKVVENLKPWRIAYCPRAKTVLELPGGTSQELGIGNGVILTFR
jgi:uncharacterized membrane protein (UPF0127 family)